MRRRFSIRQMDSSSSRAMLNPRRETSRISVQQKVIAEGVRVEVWGTVEMVSWMEERDHLGPTST